MSGIALNQSGSDNGNLAGTNGAAHTLEQGTPASTVLGNAPSSAWQRVAAPANVTVVEQLTAITIGGGGTNDVILAGLVILKNGTAVTADVTGWMDEDGDAKTIQFTGSTTVDTVVSFPASLLNGKAAYTVTASVADKVLVCWWPAA